LGSKGSANKVDAIKNLKGPGNAAIFARKWTELHNARSAATTPDKIAEAQRKIDNFNKVIIEMRDNPNFK
jgi:hypothetical protein